MLVTYFFSYINLIFLTLRFVSVIFKLNFNKNIRQICPCYILLNMQLQTNILKRSLPQCIHLLQGMEKLFVA